MCLAYFVVKDKEFRSIDRDKMSATYPAVLMFSMTMIILDHIAKEKESYMDGNKTLNCLTLRTAER